MKNQDFTQKMKELRNKKGFSQEELAEKAGLNLHVIQLIENGEIELRGDALNRFATALGVSPDVLVDWAMQDNKDYLVSLNLSNVSP